MRGSFRFPANRRGNRGVRAGALSVSSAPSPRRFTERVRASPTFPSAEESDVSTFHLPTSPRNSAFPVRGGRALISSGGRAARSVWRTVREPPKNGSSKKSSNGDALLRRFCVSIPTTVSAVRVRCPNEIGRIAVLNRNTLNARPSISVVPRCRGSNLGLSGFSVRKS